MKIKPLILATALALSGFAATSSYAADYVVDLGAPSAQGEYSAFFGNTFHIAGAFMDTFTFTPSVTGMAAGSLTTIGFTKSSDLDFTGATLNGVAFTLGGGGPGHNFGFTGLIPTAGSLIVKVWGIAAPALAAGTSISASYAGAMAVSPIPEPETYAMMMAGLGLVGFMARRRKKTESKETLPQLSAC
jgi:hypothetical protein